MRGDGWEVKSDNLLSYYNKIIYYHGFESHSSLNYYFYIKIIIRFNGLEPLYLV